MKIPEIKRLISFENIADLKLAKDSLEKDQMPNITVFGDDMKEILSHINAAIWITERMHMQGIEFKAALRDYSSLVKESISK